MLINIRKLKKKYNNYDIIFYKIVVVEIMIFKFVDNVSFI